MLPLEVNKVVQKGPMTYKVYYRHRPRYVRHL